ncbi:MAG: hypothetical protein RLZZ381_2679 [Cyanobacteriota bacterium]
MEYVIKPLDSIGHTRSSLKRLQFDSGNAELDEYIKKYAWINHQEKRLNVQLKLLIKLEFMLFILKLKMKQQNNIIKNVVL